MRPHSQCVRAILFLFVAVGLTGCSKTATKQYQGYIEGQYVYISSPQAGRLDRLSVSRGETIELRAPLFALDAEPESYAEQQAREVVRADESRLADLQTGKRPPEKEVIAAQLTQAKIQIRSPEFVEDFRGAIRIWRCASNRR